MELLIELIFKFIGQIIGEFFLSLIFTPIYFLIIKPLLILLGFVSVLIEKCFKKDVKRFKDIGFNELEKAGGDFIRGSLVLILLFLIISMMGYFAFYAF